MSSRTFPQKLDQWQITQLPPGLSKDPQTERYFNFLNRFLHDVSLLLQPVVITTTSISVTSQGAHNEIIICQAALTVTTHSNPKNRQRLAIANDDDSGNFDITVTGLVGGETTQTINTGETLDLIYIDDVAYWVFT